jgi:N6-adenosine-specific RNA methylase IME4
MDFHEVAGIFPLLEGDEYRSLRDDISANGLLEPIWIHDNKIIDGRNRYIACMDLGIEPQYRQWDGRGSLVGFAVSLNLKRRHLTSSQRAMVALEVEKQLGVEAKANLVTSTGGKNPQPFQKVEKAEPIHAAEQAAAIVGTNRQYVIDAKRIAREAPELVEKIRSGELTIPEAKKGIRRAERVDHILTIAQNNTPLNSVNGRKHNVIYADPPWRYEHCETDNRMIENQYPTMSLDDIRELPVTDIAADDCVLFMWVTSPKLDEGLSVLKSWGFNYRTCLVWIKDKIGMGYYFRQQHELLLVGTRGALPVPLPGNRVSSVLEAPRVEHSKKPAEMYEIIERMYAEYPKIELFCRSPREGWSVWGNQA